MLYVQWCSWAFCVYDNTYLNKETAYVMAHHKIYCKCKTLFNALD